MVQERVVEQEAARLGVPVTRRRAQAQVRPSSTTASGGMSNGAKNLRRRDRPRAGSLRSRSSGSNLRHELLKEKVAAHQKYLGLLPKDEKAKIAQIEVVIGELLKKAKVEYGIRCAMQHDAARRWRDGVIAQVNGEPITAPGVRARSSSCACPRAGSRRSSRRSAAPSSRPRGRSRRSRWRR